MIKAFGSEERWLQNEFLTMSEIINNCFLCHVVFPTKTVKGIKEIYLKHEHLIPIENLKSIFHINMFKFIHYF